MPFPKCFHPSPNFAAEPPNTREGVVIHHTCLSLEETIRKMLNPDSQVSYHAIIALDGSQHTLVPDTCVAWHAGVSTFLGRDHCNRFTLGLAFEGDTYRAPLLDDQIESALEWLAARWAANRWTINCITDHRQVAPGRKDDLNPPEWERFRAALARRFGV
ncbi:MAG TPA: N-acetylmuramoyl-L-alanine amidase [Opitutaceae bacterium]|nr:N-acetylmuramoyl-L-alanine amidase [Opitutaceae bacterium]